MTVLARTIRATPYRAAHEAWRVVVDLLAPSPGEARHALEQVSGIAASLISSEAPKSDPFVMWGGGPRVRVYCAYDEEALTGDGAQEGALASLPTDGDWKLSLSCPQQDLEWVAAALAKMSKRITARPLGQPVVAEEDETDSKEGSIEVDQEGFLRS